MEDVKIEDLRIGDVVLDMDGREVIIKEVARHGDQETFVWVQWVDDSVSSLGSSLNGTRVKRTKKASIANHYLKKVKRWLNS